MSVAVMKPASSHVEAILPANNFTIDAVENEATSHVDAHVSTGIRAKTWRDLDALNGEYEKLGSTTTVCPPINGESPYYERAFLIPHEALRFNLLLLERSVQPQYFQVSRQWKIKRVSHWYHQHFVHFLHDHHDVEEQIVFPHYKKAKGVSVPSSIEHDHEVLLKQIEGISAILKKMETTMDEKPLQEMADELLKQVTVFAEETRQHFAFEELHVAKIIKDNMTEEEEKATVQVVVSKLSMSQLMAELAPVVAGQRRMGGVKMEESLLAEMPLPARLLYRNFWKSQYEVENVQYICETCIDSANEPSIKRPSGWGCLRYYSK